MRSEFGKPTVHFASFLVGYLSASDEAATSLPQKPDASKSEPLIHNEALLNLPLRNLFKRARRKRSIVFRNLEGSQYFWFPRSSARWNPLLSFAFWWSPLLLLNSRPLLWLPLRHQVNHLIRFQVPPCCFLGLPLWCCDKPGSSCKKHNLYFVSGSISGSPTSLASTPASASFKIASVFMPWCILDQATCTTFCQISGSGRKMMSQPDDIEAIKDDHM